MKSVLGIDFLRGIECPLKWDETFSCSIWYILYISIIWHVIKPFSIFFIFEFILIPKLNQNKKLELLLITVFFTMSIRLYLYIPHSFKNTIVINIFFRTERFLLYLNKMPSTYCGRKVTSEFSKHFTGKSSQCRLFLCPSGKKESLLYKTFSHRPDDK